MRAGKFAVLLAATLFANGAAVAGDLSRFSVEWAKDWSAGNLDAIMQLYAPYPVFLPTSGERWEGEAAIRQHFASGISQFKADLHMTSLMSNADGHLAYDSGTYEETVTPKKGGNAMRVKGNYLFVFERVHGGEWKIQEQTFTEYGSTKL